MDLNRRTFIGTGVAAAALAGSGVARAAEPKRLALGFDNFSLRAWGWKAPKFLEFAAEQKCDGVLFSDLDVYENHGEAHLKAVREQAAELGLFVHAGTGSICPSSVSFKDKWGDAEAHLRVCLKVAKGLGTKVVRCYLGNGRDRMSEGGIRARIADTVKALKAVRSEALDLGVKFAVENHAGDMQAAGDLGLHNCPSAKAISAMQWQAVVQYVQNPRHGANPCPKRINVPSTQSLYRTLV